MNSTNLGVMLSVDGNAGAAVTARIHSGWFKFRSVASCLTAKDVSLLLRGKMYAARVYSCMVRRSETWSLNTENELATALGGNENDRCADVWCEVKGETG